jgi:hypothetical protein
LLILTIVSNLKSLYISINFEFAIQFFRILQFPEILADILVDLADIFADLADILADFADTLSGFADFADSYMCVPTVERQTSQLIREILWDCCQPAKTTRHNFSASHSNPVTYMILSVKPAYVRSSQI